MKDYALKTIFQQIFLLILAFDIALRLICYMIRNRKEGVTMTLQESKTVDHPQKREEKTQNTDSHNKTKLEQPTQLERTITTPQKFKDSTQNTTKG